MQLDTTFLERPLAWLIQASWQTAVLICLVLLVQIIFRKKLSPAWRYGLWVLVLVRLLLPTTVESAASVFNLAKTPAAQRIAARVAPVEPAESLSQTAGVDTPAASAPPEDTAVAPAEPSAKPEQRAITAVAPTPPKAPVTRWNVRQGLIDIWIAVVLLMFARVIYKNYRFSSRVVRRRPVTDEAVLSLLQDCKAEMNVHVPMDVVETRKVDSPALLGFIRPRLLLPPDMLESFPKDKLRYFFLHELAHFKRGDILVNWLMSILQILHWFNPFVWLAFSRMRADREAACDAYVMAHCDDALENRRYGEAIVDLVEFAARTHWLPGVVGILEDEKDMERRITMIAKFKAYPRWTKALAVGLMAVLAVVALTDARTPRPDRDIAEAKVEALEVEGEGPPVQMAKARRTKTSASGISEATPIADIEVGGQLVIVDSDAVPAIEKKLGMDLDPATGRTLLSEAEAAELLDALLAEESAQLVGEGTAVTKPGLNTQILAAQVMSYKTDKDWARHVGWILNVTPTQAPDGTIHLAIVPEWSDLLGMRRTRSKEVPLFHSLNYTMSFVLSPGSYLLLHGGRAPLREFHNVTYADSVSAETRERPQDYFLLLSADAVGSKEKMYAAPPEGQTVTVCRFLDLGPEAQKTLQKITGMRGLSASKTLSQQECRELVTALRGSPDAETLALSPVLAESGINAQTEWVQEVIYETGGKFLTREVGLLLSTTVTIGPDHRTTDLAIVVELAYPPEKQLPTDGFSPVSIVTSKTLTFQPGDTILSSISAGRGILAPRHRCYMAITVRRLGEDEEMGY